MNTSIGPLLLSPQFARKLIGVGTTKFYELNKLPDFPKPRFLTDSKRPMYVRQELEEWVKNLPFA